MKSKLIIGIGALAMVAGVAFSVMTYSGNASYTSVAKVYEEGRQLAEFSLTDQHGQAVNKTNLAGKWTLIFLGYTYCPDVCPATLARLANLYPKLLPLADEPVQVMFVSVDPQRDTSERLKEYVDYFNSDFMAVTNPHKDLFPFVRNLGLVYSMVDDTSQENYAVDHASSVVLIAPDKTIKAIFKPESKLGQLALVNTTLLKQDFEYIVDDY
ncbi:SCO family protein [Flocculibacter collagenilyticus]|uniref:SCO family protein n=1 Tax=Flocculibacter collagenilyticus TaxID=2744479 RepID=UPI0018F6E0D1|nr:SCO family protein [Flocculibacter collagenilyticus]